MKPAFQKNDALLADIARARGEGRARLWWLGQSGFLVYKKEATVLFDPYLSDSLTRKYAATDKPHTRITEQVIAPECLQGIDVITSSHTHTDHLDAETLQPLLAANPQAKLLIPRANRAFVLERLGKVEDSLVEVDAGESVRVAGVTFHGIAAAHNIVERDELGRCRFLGYVAQVGGRTIYHSGDTLLHDELIPSLLRFKIDVAILPINGNKPERRVAGNLNCREAAQLAWDIKARVAIPHHFDMFEFNTVSPEEFLSECGRLDQRACVLQNGQGLDL
ncbi:MAG: MBL fold metallo-hydrolase [Verrucomicrobia bacterium]|nr:MBL fold metallo-hydrolase [Verrucomicrobiota bacterium]